MTDTITITGVVATAPRHVTTSSGLSITSFRLASTQRKFDRTRNEWVDGDTNWYTISAFRQLAANILASVHLGEPVVVTGRLKIRSWQSGDKSGTSIEIDADAVGLDLSWGYTRFIKGTAVIPADAAPPEAFPGDEDAAEAREGGEALVSAGASAGSTSPLAHDSWATAPLGEGASTPF